MQKQFELLKMVNFGGFLLQDITIFLPLPLATTRVRGLKFQFQKMRLSTNKLNLKGLVWVLKYLLEAPLKALNQVLEVLGPQRNLLLKWFPQSKINWLLLHLLKALIPPLEALSPPLEALNQIMKAPSPQRNLLLKWFPQSKINWLLGSLLLRHLLEALSPTLDALSHLLEALNSPKKALNHLLEALSLTREALSPQMNLYWKWFPKSKIQIWSRTKLEVTLGIILQSKTNQNQFK